jgi:hypothetical protein
MVEVGTEMEVDGMTDVSGTEIEMEDGIIEDGIDTEMDDTEMIGTEMEGTTDEGTTEEGTTEGATEVGLTVVCGAVFHFAYLLTYVGASEGEPQVGSQSGLAGTGALNVGGAMARADARPQPAKRTATDFMAEGRECGLKRMCPLARR